MSCQDNANASNPQSWNRYAYVFNNPLRHVDPDGLEVPEWCVNDNNCQIKMRVNIIYDTRMNKGTGITPEQKAKAQKEQKKVEGILRNANVDVQRTEVSGAVTASGEISGSQKDALNIFVSDQELPRCVAGVSSTVRGVPTTQFNIDKISTDTWMTSFGRFLSFHGRQRGLTSTASSFSMWERMVAFSKTS